MVCMYSGTNSRIYSFFRRLHFLGGGYTSLSDVLPLRHQGRDKSPKLLMIDSLSFPDLATYVAHLGLSFQIHSILDLSIQIFHLGEFKKKNPIVVDGVIPTHGENLQMCAFRSGLQISKDILSRGNYWSCIIIYLPTSYSRRVTKKCRKIKIS